MVFGGGDTGNDCMLTAIAVGWLGVTQLEITPALPPKRTLGNVWPEWPMTLKAGYGQKEAKALFGGDVTT